MIYRTTIYQHYSVIDDISNYSPTWLSSPSKMIMTKKRADQAGARGIWATASGYAINASPGPASFGKKEQMVIKLKGLFYHSFWKLNSMKTALREFSIWDGSCLISYHSTMGDDLETLFAAYGFGYSWVKVNGRMWNACQRFDIVTRSLICPSILWDCQ